MSEDYSISPLAETQCNDAACLKLLVGYVGRTVCQAAVNTACDCRGIPEAINGV